MDPGHSSYFLAVPAVLVILLNIVCLVTVIRVVRNKLIFENSFNRNNDIAAKSAKASCSKAKATQKTQVVGQMVKSISKVINSQYSSKDKFFHNSYQMFLPLSCADGRRC